MSINGLGQFGGFYNNYNVPQIKQVSVEEVQKQDQQASQNSKPESLETLAKEYSQPEKPQASRMADLENISLSFNANDTYEYLGKDAAVENLDMMSAISDMQKDQVLQQYQYFVGPQEMDSDVVANNADGMVIRK